MKKFLRITATSILGLGSAAIGMIVFYAVSTDINRGVPIIHADEFTFFVFGGIILLLPCLVAGAIMMLCLKSDTWSISAAASAFLAVASGFTDLLSNYTYIAILLVASIALFSLWYSYYDDKNID